MAELALWSVPGGGEWDTAGDPDVGNAFPRRGPCACPDLRYLNVTVLVPWESIRSQRTRTALQLYHYEDPTMAVNH